MGRLRRLFDGQGLFLFFVMVGLVGLNFLWLCLALVDVLFTFWSFKNIGF